MDNRPTVLIVDDVAGNRLIIRKVIGDEHYRSLEAANGWEAVQVALQEVPDLILMDIMMPEMDGYTAIRRLKENEKTQRIPILVITALTEKTKRIAALEAGAMDFITKPFDRHELLAHVRSYTRLSQLNKKYVLSTIDVRTGLPNKSALEEDLQRALAPKLFVVKVDNLESVSRFYGNEISSRIEARLGEMLPRFISQKLSLDSKIYFVTDATFGILMDDPDGVVGDRGVLRICELLAGQLRKQSFSIQNHDFAIEVSIGVSMGGGDVLQKALLAVDRAMLNKVRWFIAEDIIDDLHKDIEHNMFWLGRIRGALQKDLFVPFFQPIQNNRTGVIDKFESLIRIVDPDGRVTAPGQFLPVAKKSKYYQELTRLMVDKTLRIFRHRREMVSLNLSVLDIENAETRSLILDAVKSYPSVSNRLILELVEEEGVKNFDQVHEFIDAVKQFGVQIAIDDFGSGYSNFMRLMELKFDFLKLDGSLVRRILDDPVSRRVVRMMTEISRESGVLTVAEYVENQALQDELVSLGVDYSQGYLIGKPCPLD